MTNSPCGRFRSLALSCILVLLCPLVQASDETQIKLIFDAVRSQYPDVNLYCKLSDTDRRKVVVQSTLQLANKGQVSDPYVDGPKAGALLRQECGVLDIPTVDKATMRWMTNEKPLTFDSEVGRLGMFTSIQAMANRVYVPQEGTGPFPAVVLSHTIGSISPHLLVHAKDLLAAGFAVLVVDTYGPRGVKNGISKILPTESAKDAYDALAHLQAQAFIDRNRIFQSGYSLGGIASSLLASPQGAKALNASGRFRATVSNYGGCVVSQMDVLSSDSDRPLLMLMAELDIEASPRLCFPLLDNMKAAGKDVQWHIYPQTTHGWDKAENNGYVYRSPSGETMPYRYDPTVAKDATERMISFFNRYR
jgi:dienelactone hydrolase